jgi:hypothetical protein
VVRNSAHQRMTRPPSVQSTWPVSAAAGIPARAAGVAVSLGATQVTAIPSFR